MGVMVTMLVHNGMLWILLLTSSQIMPALHQDGKITWTLQLLANNVFILALI